MNVDIVNAISTLPGTAVLIALLVAASLLVIFTNWRLLILALGAQYILIGLMLTRVVPIELAAVKALVGVMICPVLYITARRVNWGQITPDDDDDDEVPDTPRPKRRWWWIVSPGLPVRLIVTALGVAISLSLANRNPLPITADQALSRDFTIATFSVILLGLINAALAENPLKVGMGLLSLLAGFELFYTSVEPTLTIVGLLGLTNLIIALAIAYLTTAWAAHRTEVQL